MLNYSRNTLLWTFAFLSLFLWTSPLLAKHHKPIEEPGVHEITNVEDYLIQLNREMLEQYILYHNTEPNSRIMLNDYIFVASIGVIETKEEVISTVGNLDIHSADITHNEFRRHGQTAVLVGTLGMQGSISGNNINSQIRYMSVFIYQQDKWRLMARSFSPIVHPSVLYGGPERP